MRIVWKDSSATEPRKPLKYRKHFVRGYGEGWITDLPGDDNIYKNHYCAFNAIDKALGNRKREACEKQTKYGIQIIGVKNNESA